MRQGCICQRRQLKQSDYAGNGLFIRIERDDRPGIYNSGELSDSVVNLRPGETYTVSAHSDIWDLFTDFDFTWSVEDESVASVAPNDGDVFSATITANEIGSTTLKLTNGFLKEMTCTINVVAESYDISLILSVLHRTRLLRMRAGMLRISLLTANQSVPQMNTPSTA